VSQLVEGHLVAVEVHGRARIGRVVTGEHLDQRRLAGTVVPDEGVHLAGPHLEVDLDQRARARKRLRQVLDPDDLVQRTVPLGQLAPPPCGPAAICDL
jgi:hypothetical protein